VPATLLPASAHALFDVPLPDRAGALALSRLPGVGPRTWRTLLAEHAGDADQAAAARRRHDVRAWAAARDDARALLDAAADGPYALLLPGDAAYPRPLLDLPDPPVTLWVAGGGAALAHAPRVAVVGTRANTALGERTTRRLVGVLAECGAAVVSGMARGIDTVAHAAALASGAPTVAVLGTGVDVPYPRQNAALYERIVASGVVVAELPPGTQVAPGLFPRRNRVVAALADVVVVVEAPDQSGALITAGMAADLGRTVAAVPGSVEAPTAAGTNRLLRDGAHVLADARDVAGLLGLPGRPATPDPLVAEPLALGDDERRVWRALAEPAADLDALVQRTGLPPGRCAAAVTALELRDHVASDPAGELRRA
jgi:DNA processing protein